MFVLRMEMVIHVHKMAQHEEKIKTHLSYGLGSTRTGEAQAFLGQRRPILYEIPSQLVLT